MLEDIRFVKAPLHFSYDLLQNNKENYEKEFTSMSEYEEDPIGQWLKIAKAKGDTNESDPILLELIVELHKKVDRLTDIIKNEERKLLELPNKEMIEEIGFEHIKVENGIFQKDKDYYIRIQMPVFPKREMPLIIKAVDDKVAKIVKIHQKDEKDWSAYMMARERVMTREAKAKNNV
jgi:hypothetical protein